MKIQKKPTSSELKILQIIWQNGPSTVKEINDIINLSEKVGYTTTLKLMQIMKEKGILSREKFGRSHTYKAELKESETKSQLVDKLLDTVFGGSASKLVMHALGNGKASKTELEEIKNLLEKLENEIDDSN